MLAAFALLAAVVSGPVPRATAKHEKSLDDLNLSTLMGEMKVQAIKPVPLPAFTLPDLANKEFAIKDQVGKVILINFWTTY
jgi:hypothetical protein